MLVSDILREKGRDILSIPREATLFEASVVLSRNRVGALLIQDSTGALHGIISERDIVRAIAEDGPNAFALTVGARMTKDVATCSESTTIEEITEIMTRCRFRHMPVVRNGCVTGIVSIGDVVKTRIAETLREAEALKVYIGTG